MRIAKAVGIIALAFVASTAAPAVHAATLETQTIEGWTLNAYSSEKTGAFQSCSMKAAGNDQVYLTVSANTHNRWFLWLYRAKWDLEPDTRFIATLNLDQDRKDPIPLEAKLSNDRFIALALPPERHVLDLLSKAEKARVSRETKDYTFPLTGYDSAVRWMKSCVARHNTPEAAKPDATIKGQDEDTTDAAGIELRKESPAEAPKVAPKLPAGVIEVKAPDTAKPNDVVASAPTASTTPVIATLSPVPTAPVAPTPAATQPQGTMQTANAPVGVLAPDTQMSEAAKATPTPLGDQIASIATPIATSGPTSAQQLLPKLMTAANRSDFKLLDADAAPEALHHADVVFSLTGLTGVVISLDLPTAEAATNEILAYDRIACGGAYTAATDPVEDGHTDVMRSTSQCQSGDKSVLAHYMTLSRKSGGFYVVGLTTGTTGATDKLTDTDHALFAAALKVSGKF